MSHVVWPASGCIAAGCGTVVKVWEANDFSSAIQLSDGTEVISVDFSRNNKVLAVAAKYGQAVMYSSRPPPQQNGDRAVGRFPTQPLKGLDAIKCVKFSPTDQYLVGGCGNGSVYIWSLREKVGERVWNGINGTLTSVAINHKEDVLASTSSAGQVLLHNFKTGAKLKSLAREGGPAADHLGFSRLSPDLLAWGTAAGAVVVWDLGRLEQVDQFTAHKGKVTGLSFSEVSPDMMLSCGGDGVLKCSDRRTQREAWSVTSRQPFTALSAKYDGQLLAVGNTAGQVLMYDVRNMSSQIAMQQFSEHRAVSTVRWQHPPKPSRSSSSAGTTSTAASGAAVAAAGNSTDAVPSRRQQQQQDAQGQKVAAGPAGSEVAGGRGAGSWPRSTSSRRPTSAAPASAGESLEPEASNTSVTASLELGCRAFSPVQMFGSPDAGGPDDAATTPGLGMAPDTAAAAAAAAALHTPEMATPADSALSGPVAPFMFTPGIGLGHVALNGSTPSGLTATPDLTPISKPSGPTGLTALAVAAVPPPAVPPPAAVGPAQPAAPQVLPPSPAAAVVTGNLSRRQSNSSAADSKAAAAGSRPNTAAGRAPLSSSTATAAASGGTPATAAGSGRGLGSRASSSSSLTAAAAAGRTGSRPFSGAGAGSSAATASGGASSRRSSRMEDTTESAPGGGGPAAAAGSVLYNARVGDAVGSRPSTAGTSVAAVGGVAVGGLQEGVFKAYVDQQIQAVREDVANMHLDMIKQFHQAQMDLMSVVTDLAQRQDQLAEAINQLTTAVQGARLTKQHPGCGSISMMPWI